MSFVLPMFYLTCFFAIDLPILLVNADYVHIYLLRMQMILFHQLSIIFLWFLRITKFLAKKLSYYSFNQEEWDLTLISCFCLKRLNSKQIRSMDFLVLKQPSDITIFCLKFTFEFRLINFFKFQMIFFIWWVIIRYQHRVKNVISF